MSMWSQSAPQLSMRWASEAKLAKSDESIEGAILGVTPIASILFFFLVWVLRGSFKALSTSFGTWWVVWWRSETHKQTRKDNDLASSSRRGARRPEVVGGGRNLENYNKVGREERVREWGTVLLEPLWIWLGAVEAANRVFFFGLWIWAFMNIFYFIFG